MFGWEHAHASSGGIHWVGIITAASAVVAAGGVGLVYRTVRQGEQSRQDSLRALHAQTAAEISRRWADPLMVECRRLVRNYSTRAELADAFDRYRSANAAEGYVFQRELDFFEDLAVSEKLGTIGWEFIELSLGAVVWDRWEMWEPTISLVWPDEPSVYENFRALAFKMKDCLNL